MVTLADNIIQDAMSPELNLLPVRDVKIFINRVKKNMKEGTFNLNQALEFIDNEAGPELIDNNPKHDKIKKIGEDQYLIESDSTEGVFYKVFLDKISEDWQCTCPAGMHDRHCKHLGMVQEFQENE